MVFSIRKLSATVPFVLAMLSASSASAAEQRYLVERIPGIIDGQSLGMLLDATDDGIVSFSSRNNSGQEGSVILDLLADLLPLDSLVMMAANIRQVRPATNCFCSMTVR